jgi:hypothetical protein
MMKDKLASRIEKLKANAVKTGLYGRDDRNATRQLHNIMKLEDQLRNMELLANPFHRM